VAPRRSLGFTGGLRPARSFAALKTVPSEVAPGGCFAEFLVPVKDCLGKGSGVDGVHHLRQQGDRGAI
jgi:hypothetical protein